jgi:hypothetical protein
MNSFWIWRLDRLAGTVTHRNRLDRAQASRVIIKSRDGLTRYNAANIEDTAKMLQDTGIEVWLWAWVYARNGNTRNPDFGGRAYLSDQAQALLADADRIGATGVVANIEAPFSAAINHRWAPGHARAWGDKQARKAELTARANLYMSTLSQSAGFRQVGLSTFPLPAQHALPFQTLAAHATVVMPQLYFGGATGLQAKLARSIAQWRALTYAPLRYTGSIFKSYATTRTTIEAAAHHNVALDWWSFDQAKPDALRALSEATSRHRSAA